MDTTALQDLTQKDTATYQDGTSIKLTTPSDLQTTTRVLGKFYRKLFSMLV